MNEPATTYLDVSDRLNRAKAMLDFVIDTRIDADGDSHPGETWILGAISEAIGDAKALLNQKPLPTP